MLGYRQLQSIRVPYFQTYNYKDFAVILHGLLGERNNDLNSKKAKSSIPQIINIYNDKRPHLSIDLLTPTQAHQMQGELNRLWNNYPKKNRFVSDERSGYEELST